MICITTRFGLKHWWDLVPMYRHLWRMEQDLREAPGLLRHTFAVAGPRACFTLSVWRDEAAVQAFTNRPSHVRAVRYAKQTCAAIWSAYWRLDALSAFAHDWPGDPWPPLQPHPQMKHRLVPIDEQGAHAREGLNPLARETNPYGLPLADEEACP